jgi:hypothetical protein
MVVAFVVNGVSALDLDLLFRNVAAAAAAAVDDDDDDDDGDNDDESDEVGIPVYGLGGASNDI